MAKHPATFACRIAACLCGVLALEGCGSPLEMSLAPITTTGSVQSTVIGRRSSDGTSELTVQESVSVDVTSYIWQPWFVQVRGGADLAHDKTFGNGSDSKCEVVTGGTVTLALDVGGFGDNDGRAELEVRYLGGPDTCSSYEISYKF